MFTILKKSSMNVRHTTPGNFQDSNFRDIFKWTNRQKRFQIQQDDEMLINVLIVSDWLSALGAYIKNILTGALNLQGRLMKQDRLLNLNKQLYSKNFENWVDSNNLININKAQKCYEFHVKLVKNYEQPNWIQIF